MKKEQLGKLIIASEDTMYHVAKTLLYNDADCADAIQETIVKAFTKIKTLKSDDYAKTWLIRILINECYAIMRKEKNIVSLEAYAMKEKHSDMGAMDVEQKVDLYNAIGHLSEKSRLAIVLYYIEGYSVKEIAKMFETSESAIKNRLARAREKMKGELTKEAAQI